MSGIYTTEDRHSFRAKNLNILQKTLKDSGYNIEHRFEVKLGEQREITLSSLITKSDSLTAYFYSRWGKLWSEGKILTQNDERLAKIFHDEYRFSENQYGSILMMTASMGGVLLTGLLIFL